MNANQTLKDGIYIICPEGCGWEAVQVRDGRVTAEASEAVNETFKAANDWRRHLCPPDNAQGVEELSLSEHEALVALCHPDHNPECYGTGRLRDTDEDDS